MKERIHVKFNKITGNDLSCEFFKDSAKPVESLIHHTYINETGKCSNHDVEIGSVKNDDGVITFKYKGKPVFYGRFECKRNINPTKAELDKALLQLLHYHYQSAIKPRNPVVRNTEVFVIASSKFFATIYMEDLEFAIKRLTPMFDRIKCSASTAYKDLELRSVIKMLTQTIPIHVEKIDSKFRLDETYKNIYKHCL